MTHPFSDTTTPHAPREHDHSQAALLALRLGLPERAADEYGRWQNTLFAAAHQMLDRVEQLERQMRTLIEESQGPNRG
jgi:hypothetical protein